MLDDIIDDVEPWCLLAGFLKEQGAQKVYAMAPHGILSGNALELINSSASLDQVVITNTGEWNMSKIFLYEAGEWATLTFLSKSF